MNSLKRMVLPLQIVAWLTLPMIMVTIITAVFAGCISMLTSLTFHDVTHSTPMWVFNVIVGIGSAISVGSWLWDEN